MRIENLSEDNIRLLRDLIDYQLPFYDSEWNTLNLKRKEAHSILDSLIANPSFITPAGTSGMMTDIIRQCNYIMHPSLCPATNAGFVNKNALIEILSEYDPKLVEDLIRSIDWHWPFEGPKVDTFYPRTDFEIPQKSVISNIEQLGIKPNDKLTGVGMIYNKIILHIPHSSCNFDFANQEQYVPDWQKQAKPYIDWHTDELFTPNKSDERIIPLIFDTCRTLVDVERMCDDPLEARGLGITAYALLKTKDSGYSIGGSQDERNRYMKKYLDHQHKLAHLLVENNLSLLIDCHSFSSRPTILQPDIRKYQDIDICIGFNEDRTKPDGTTLALVAQHFIDKGYKVAFNEPFSNSKTVETPAKYTSLMIEVNKSLYMDESTLQKKAAFESLKYDIESLYKKLLQ